MISKFIIEMIENFNPSLIIVIIILYIVLLSNDISIPIIIQKLFNNTIFKIIILFIIIYINNENLSPKLSILIVIAYVLTLDYIYVMNSSKIHKSILKN